MTLIEIDRASFWATPVHTISYGNCDLFLKELSEAVLREEIRLSSSNAVFDTLLFNRFSTARDQQDLLSQGNCMEELFQIITKNAEVFLQENYPQFLNGFTVSIWSNIHRLGDWHGLHSHYSGGPEIASGVFWVAVPIEVQDDEATGGKLILFDPRGPFFPERKRVVITPTAGNLVIFPAWLQHEVSPLRCEGPRISIAFDIKKS